MSTKQSTVAIVDLGLISKNVQDKHEMSPFRRFGRQTLLEWTIRRLSDSLLLDSIAVTGDNAHSLSVQQSHLQPSRWFPMCHSSPLHRIKEVALKMDAEWVVLVSPCCPFIDPVLVDRLVAAAWAAPEYDSVAFVSSSRPTFSLDGLGLVAEVCNYRVLEKLSQDPRFANDPRRVPQLVRSMPESFHARLLPLPASIDRDDVRFALETEDDWDRAHMILEASGDDCDYRELADLAVNFDSLRTRFA